MPTIFGRGYQRSMAAKPGKYSEGLPALRGEFCRGVGFEFQRLLHEPLAGDNFVLLGRFPVVSKEPRWRGENLLLYQKKPWAPPTNQISTIRMLTIPHDIAVPH